MGEHKAEFDFNCGCCYYYWCRVYVFVKYGRMRSIRRGFSFNGCKYLLVKDVGGA